jgi:hypothetical protein
MTQGGFNITICYTMMEEIRRRFGDHRIFKKKVLKKFHPTHFT